MEDVLFYQNYTVAGDVIALILCFVVSLLMRSTYTVKKTNLMVFKRANGWVALAATSSMLYHELIKNMTIENVPLIYFFRATAYTALILTFVCFCIYVKNLVEMDPKFWKVFRVTIFGAGIFFSVLQFVGPYLKFGFYIDENLQVHQNYYFDIFRIAYIYYSLAFLVLFVSHQKRFIKKIRNCIIGVVALSYILMASQTIHLNTTYTAASFMLPIIAALFLFHYNAYNAETATLDQTAFDEFVEEVKGKKYSFIMLSLPDISRDNMQYFSKQFLKYNYTYFKESNCFQLRDNKIVLVYQKGRNSDYEKVLDRLYKDFVATCDERGISYRVILVDNIDEFAHGTELLYFCTYLEPRLQMKAIKQVKLDDIKQFQNFKKMYQHIKDIYDTNDLEDERVKVYCQPVLNTKTNRFNTAEALMRLELPELGMIYPDQFIPLLEGQGFMHVYSNIILNKTCKEIKRLETEGYNIERISVNFSVQELQLENFCDDVINIIKQNDIPLNKIAIELTESRNEKDFLMMKKVLENLHKHGIKFYLDDFGTGYSNFERIIELPVDTIKFDRSLTILASKNEESRFMVGSFSEIFKRANYQILFEGVEDEKDESQCIDMKAQYLQGYRYSRPIPIAELRNFLEKKA